jgi:CRISPR system Cascade subunit CasC
MLIDIHMLQNHQPSNLNRDDTGAPKDAVFGGVRRGRISSQCLKRSIRRSPLFREAFTADDLAMRTQLLPELLDEAMARMGVEDEIRKAVVHRAPEIGTEAGGGGKADGGDEEPDSASTATQVQERAKTNQLIFISPEEVDRLASMLADICRQMSPKTYLAKGTKIADITKKVGMVLPRSVDIAMFGRMTTSAAFENVSAAVQVAHALSTNRLDSEFDYFTAVDDISGESGAGMIGDVEFNSATYYKYFSIQWEDLIRNLAGDVATARRAVRAMVEAAALSNPSGKQNSFAAHNPPDLVMVEIRPRNVPLSYANAFLQPCRPRDGRSLMDVSVSSLSDYLGRIGEMYAVEGQRLHADTGHWDVPGSTRCDSFGALLSGMEARLT